MSNPDWEVTTPVDLDTGGTAWHKVGVGWTKGEKIILDLNSFPAKGGRLVLFKWRSQEEKEEIFARKGQNRGYGGQGFDNDLDDDVPF